jgi:hypothetical protein
MPVSIEHCARAFGRDVRTCACCLPNGAGWAECPAETRGVLPPRRSPQPAPRPQFSGNECEICGGFMAWTGTCQTCQSCGNSGGCG